jgi:hypothetical protein
MENLPGTHCIGGHLVGTGVCLIAVSKMKDEDWLSLGDSIEFSLLVVGADYGWLHWQGLSLTKLVVGSWQCWVVVQC